MERSLQAFRHDDDASSAQAAIVGGVASAFWIDGTVDRARDRVGRRPLDDRWRQAPTASPSDPGVLSDLRVALASDGSGVAAWIRTDGNTVTVETATIAANGDWTARTAHRLRPPTTRSTVAVADGSGVVGGRLE